MMNLRITFASLILVAAACGGDDGVRHLDGGPTIDSPIGVPDAPITPQPVTLTVKLGGIGQSNIKVYFLASDSTVISNTMTDATGVASAVMPGGGTVTAINPFDAPAGLPTTAFHLFTFSGVKPGDHLKLDQDNSASTLTDVTFNASVDDTSGVAGYHLSTPCVQSDVAATGQTPPTFVVSVPSGCATTSDILVYSKDNAGQPLHYFFIANQAITATTDLTAANYVSPTTKSYAITNGLTFGNEYNLQQYYASLHGKLFQYGPQGSSGSGVFSLPAPAFTNALDIVTVQGSVGGRTNHVLADWGPFANTYAIDLAARALHDINTVPSFNTTTHQIEWTEATPGSTPDFTVAEALALRTGSPTNYSFDWKIAAPYAAGHVLYPTLPTDVLDFTLTDADGPSVGGVTLAKVPGGYDAVRASILDQSQPLDLITTPTGSAAVEWYGNGIVLRQGGAAPKVPQPLSHTSRTRR